MIYNKLTIENFRSFKNKEVFIFPEKSVGFHLLSGENQVEPKLGANGVGKSSIWDALTWVLFGKTARGLKAGDIANWDANKGYEVTLDFQADQSYTLTRSWKPNKLTLNSNIVTQKELEDIIGFNYTSFLNTILMGQFNQFFFDLTPTEKLTVFSEALDLQYWLEASKKASIKAKSLDIELRDFELELAKSEKEQALLEEQKSSIQDDIKQFETDKKKRIANKENRLDKVVDELEAAEKQLEPIDKDLAGTEGGQELWHNNQKALQEVVKNTGGTLQSLYHEIRGFEKDELRWKKEWDKFEVSDGTCPYCNQKITEIHIKKELVRIEQEVKNITIQIDKLEKQREKAQKENDKAKLALADAEAVIEEMNKMIQGLNRDKIRINQEITTLLSESTMLDKEIDNIINEENVYEGKLEKLILRVEKLKETNKKINVKFKEKTQEYNAATFWAKEFKSLRLWLVEEALKELEIEVNNSLISLGLHGWKISFDIERENKSGGVTKGFSVFITAPNSSTSVPWEGWSGGETQRLRIAGAIGLSNLICSRRGIKSSLEIWDEPTAHLSEEGILDLLDFFADRTVGAQKQIWLVEHKSLDFGGFDSIVKIIKTSKGSHIIYNE
jgi:DNA repair exonuclease SbcCD ATPase subunit